MPAVVTFASLETTLQTYLERGDSVSDPTVFAQIPLIINNGERRVARALKVQGFEQYIYGAFTPGAGVYPKPDRWRDNIEFDFGTGPTLTVNQRQTIANVRTLITQQPMAPLGLTVGAAVGVGGVGSTGYNGSFTVSSLGFSQVAYAAAGSNETLVADGTGLVFNPALMTKRKFLKYRTKEVVEAYWPDPTQNGEPRFYSDFGLSYILVAPTPILAYPFKWGYWELPQLLDASNQENYQTIYAPNLLLYSCLLEAVPFLKEDNRVPTWKGMYDEALGALSAEDIRKMRDRAMQRDTA